MPAPHPDVAAWVERARQRDEAGCRALVEHCQPLVVKLVRAHLPRTWSEEDLVQEAFVKMFARLDRYQAHDGVPFVHWLSRLTVNTCLDALRAEARQPRKVALSPEAEGWLSSLRGEAAPEHGDVGAAREAVEALLAHLEPADRLVLTLLDLEERSTAEIAQLTGWSRPLVKVRAFRARLRLRAIAKRLHPDGNLP